MLAGKADQSTTRAWWTQVSKASSLKDVKKRMVDHLKAAGYQVELTDVRLWLYSKNNYNTDKTIESRIA